MNSKFKKLISNTSFSLAAQVIALSVSTFSVLFLPKYLDIMTFSYWQLYLLYASYAGLLHFGLIDGIYLRHGGLEYKSLDKGVFRAQFRFLYFSQGIFAIVILFCSLYFLEKNSKQIIFIAISFYVFLVMINTFFNFILQTTNRIKEYVIIVITDRLTFLILISVVLLLRLNKLEYVILADLASKAISLIPSFFYNKEIIIGKAASWKITITEVWRNISAGIKLMFSNIAGMLLIGIVRLLIEQNWDIITFGKISFTLSISNVFLVFISAVSIVIFPMLKRLSGDRQTEIYFVIRNLLMVMLSIAILFYYPLRYALSLWLPAFEDKLVYLIILLPICLFESKMTLLMSTFLKALRKEYVLLKINILSLIVCLLINLIAIYYFNSLNFTVLSIIIVFAFRAVVAELYLARVLKLSLTRDIILEILLTVVFVFFGWHFSNLISFIIYLFALIIYLAIKKTDIYNSIRLLKHYSSR